MSKAILSLLFSFLFFISAINFASAATCASAKVNIIARNQDDKYISNINFEIYKQVTDVDGKTKPGVKVAGGKTGDNLGYGSVSFTPEEDTDYALKMWDKNSKLGEFWYYDELFLTCGSETTITKYLSGIRLSFYNPNGDLLKNVKGSLYTQRFDIENNPIKESQDLVGNFDTSAEGAAYFYIGGKQFDQDNNSTGLYVVEAYNENRVKYRQYGVEITDENTNYFNYIFSEARFILKDSTTGALVPKYKIEIYKQSYGTANEKKLGEYLRDIYTDERGVAVFQNSEILLAARVKNANGEYEYFWEKEIADQRRLDYNLSITSKKTNSNKDGDVFGGIQGEKGTNNEIVKTSKVNVVILDSKGKASAGTIGIYKLINIGGNNYEKGGMLKSLKVTKATDLSISTGPYLFIIHNEWGDYGQALYVDSSGKQSVVIRVASSMDIKKDRIFVLKKPANLDISNNSSNNLSGRILLRTQGHGEAYYINPTNNKKYYLPNGEVAFKMMRSFGLGISNADLKKIPIGVDVRFNKDDTDEDGLSDALELAIGTGLYKRDSDVDGFTDGDELKSGHNPLGLGSLPIDKKLISKLKGRIVLQVQSNGEAWYINPVDGKRYYMASGTQAFEIMKFLSLGVKDSVLAGILEGEL